MGIGNGSDWFDSYNRKARLYPGLWAVSPVAVVVISLGIKDAPVISALLGLLSAIGGPVLLSGYVRLRGSELEPALFESWGGVPTTQLLRASSSGNQALREQRRRAVEDLTDTELLTAKQERRDQAAADDRIGAALAILRERTRDQQKYPLVYFENTSYGFQRNLLGMRRLGLAIAGGGVAVMVVAAVLNALSILSLPWLGVGVGLAASLAVLLVWLVVPTEGRVRQAADKYAERILDTAVGEATPGSKARKKK